MTDKIQTIPDKEHSLIEVISRAIDAEHAKNIEVTFETYNSRLDDVSKAALDALCKALGCSIEVLEGIRRGDNVVIKSDYFSLLSEKAGYKTGPFKLNTL